MGEGEVWTDEWHNDVTRSIRRKDRKLLKKRGVKEIGTRKNKGGKEKEN